MYTLHYKRKKDKGVWFDRSDVTHKGTNGHLTKDEQKEGMKLVIDEMQILLNKLEKLGYDKQTAKFSIKEKKQ